MSYCGYNVFQCDGCNKYKSTDQIHIKKAIFSKFNRDSEKHHVFIVHHVALCEKCNNELNTIDEK